jgi:protein SCO1/2
VLLVSFDPANDTPARLQQVAREHHLDARWTLASATDGDARTLAAVLDVHYRKLGDGSFAHDSVVVALDADGRPIARMRGLGDHAALAAALRK